MHLQLEVGWQLSEGVEGNTDTKAGMIVRNTLLLSAELRQRALGSRCLNALQSWASPFASSRVLMCRAT